MAASLRDDDNEEVRIPRLASNAGYPSVDPQLARLTSTPKTQTTEGGYGTPETRDWYYFSLELRTALEAGVSFVQALSLVLENTTNKSIKRALNQVLAQLRQGLPLEKIMAQRREIPPLIRNLVVVGTRGGNAPAALKQITDHYQWLLEMRGRILRVIVYPSSLLVLGSLIMFGRDVTIASMTGHMSAESAAIYYGLKYTLPIVAGAGAAIILAWACYTPLLRPSFDKLVLTAPVMGKMIRAYALSVFFRVLALLIEAGMPITQAWILATQSATNYQVGVQLQAGLHYLQDGESLDEALRQTKIINKEARALAYSGAVAGTTGHLLRKYADYSEESLKWKFRGMAAAIGPFCLAGIVLGYFVHPAWLGVLAFVLVLARRLV